VSDSALCPTLEVSSRRFRPQGRTTCKVEHHGQFETIFETTSGNEQGTRIFFGENSKVGDHMLASL
jgi:hypothetical protein